MKCLKHDQGGVVVRYVLISVTFSPEGTESGGKSVTESF